MQWNFQGKRYKQLVKWARNSERNGKIQGKQVNKMVKVEKNTIKMKRKRKREMEKIAKKREKIATILKNYKKFCK